MLKSNLLVFLLLTGCSTEKAVLPTGGDLQPVLGVRVAKPKARIGSELVRATGTVRAKQEAVLSAPATGTIAKFFVKAGDKVKNGQALVQLDTSNVAILVDQARAARSMAEAGFDASRIELDRAKQLRATDAAPVAVLDRAIAANKQAQAGLEVATAAMHSAEENLRDHTLRAPFDGVVIQRYKNIGETVAMVPPTAIISVVDADHLEVRVPVPETVVDFIKVGAVAKGVLSPSGKLFEAKVASVGAVVDQATRTVEVLADVVGVPGRDMRPGALADLDFSSLVGDGLAGLYVPSQAIRQEAEKNFVFVIKEGVAEQREVKIEPVTPGIVRVREGLNAQDDVVVEGSSGLKTGARVRATS